MILDFFYAERDVFMYLKLATCNKLLIGILKGARGHSDSYSRKTGDPLDLFHRSVLG